MTKHFACTACGKCCYGLLPLTFKDAFANIGRFPLCLSWTPVLKGSKDFPMVKTLGVTITVAKGQELAVLIVPTSFIPSSLPCPALQADNLCGIHESKPSRCKTMPFYPYRDERFQAELTNPRPGWECDTSTSAPLVYQEQKIVDREDFDRERQELLDEVPLLRRYADYMFKYSHSLPNNLMFSVGKTKAHQVVTSLSSFLTATQNTDARNIAQQQLPILKTYAEQTAGDPKLAFFHNNYVNWSKEMAYLAK